MVFGWCFVVALISAARGSQNVYADSGIFDQWAKNVVQDSAAKWKGPRVPFAKRTPRPSQGFFALQSSLYPLTVHVNDQVPFIKVLQTLRELEHVHERWRAQEWPINFPDAAPDAGGTGFDLYVASAVDAPVATFVDGPVWGEYLDAASTFAVMDATVPDAYWNACISQAYVEAQLLAQDPAEAAAWIQSMAIAWTWEQTGLWGCQDSSMEKNSIAAPSALFLGWLADTVSNDAASFWQELWQHSRQRTWEGVGLRASPDLWMVIERASVYSHASLAEWLTDFAMDRFFIGSPKTRSLHTTPSDAHVSVFWKATYTDLPAKSPSSEPLNGTDSAYALIDTANAPPGALLKLWLHGEYGVSWGLSALRLDEHHQEQNRIRAPAQNSHEIYLPLELRDHTHRVLVVVTQLGKGVPDADVPNEYVRSFVLTADH